MSTDIEATALRGPLRIRSAEGAADLLQLTAQQLGAVLVLADEAGPDALPIDLSLGEGPPLLAVVDPLSPTRMELEHILRRLVDDARQAVDLLHQTDLSMPPPRALRPSRRSGGNDRSPDEADEVTPGTSGRSAHCPMAGCGAHVPVAVPAGAGPNRWLCPGCRAPLEYSVSTGKLTAISHWRRSPGRRP